MVWPLRFIEACLLAAMGAFMVALALSSGYWQYLNPKYSWLTLTAGTCVVALGFGSLFDLHRRRKATELGAVIVFLFLAGGPVRTLPDLLFEPVAASPQRGGLTFFGRV